MDTLERDEKKSQTLWKGQDRKIGEILRSFTSPGVRSYTMYVQLVPQIFGGEINDKS